MKASNRVRKHRAWHREAKKMLTGTSAQIFKWLDEGQPVDVMDWVGLLDKNGVEIYEGDIIKCPNNTTSVIQFGAWEYEEVTESEDVTIRGIGFSFDGNEPFGECAKGDGVQYEVIGNCHQHPELLTSNAQSNVG